MPSIAGGRRSRRGRFRPRPGGPGPRRARPRRDGVPLRGARQALAGEPAGPRTRHPRARRRRRDPDRRIRTLRRLRPTAGPARPLRRSPSSPTRSRSRSSTAPPPRAASASPGTAKAASVFVEDAGWKVGEVGDAGSFTDQHRDVRRRLQVRRRAARRRPQRPARRGRRGRRSPRRSRTWRAARRSRWSSGRTTRASPDDPADRLTMHAALTVTAATESLLGRGLLVPLGRIAALMAMLGMAPPAADLPQPAT